MSISFIVLGGSHCFLLSLLSLLLTLLVLLGLLIGFLQSLLLLFYGPLSLLFLTLLGLFCLSASIFLLLDALLLTILVGFLNALLEGLFLLLLTLCLLEQLLFRFLACLLYCQFAGQSSDFGSFSSSSAWSLDASWGLARSGNCLILILLCVLSWGSSSLLSDFLLSGSFRLAVGLLILLLACELLHVHLGILLHLGIAHLRFIMGLLFSVCGQSLGSLGCFSFPLFSVRLLNNSVLLITYPVELSDSLLPFSLCSKLLLALGLLGSELALALLFLLLLLLLLKVRLELLNGAIVLLGELLKLRSMLLLLLFLFGALVFLFLAHQLVH